LITPEPLILTIITPVYNGSAYLQGCLENVANQWIEGIEHLIIDGGSKDGTIDILEEYSAKYPHIRWISEKDKGQSDAMNKGIHMAKGSWISFLNVDDFYESKSMISVLEKIKSRKNHGCLLVGNLKIWNEKEELISINRPSSISLPLMLADICEWPFNPSAYFYPASIHQKIGYFPEEEHYAMDYDFFFKVVLAKIPILYFNEVWGNFRLLPDAKTGKDQIENTSFQRAALIRKHYLQLSAPNIQIQVWFLKRFWSVRNKMYSMFIHQS